MKYKRDEAFRYSFKQPIEMEFKLLLEKDGVLNETRSSTATLLDISPRGVRLKTPLSLPLEDQMNYLLEMHFKLNEVPISIIGKPVWKRKEFNYYLYGIEALEDKQTEEIIIQELKHFAKTRKNRLEP
ncbi:PilZ domain-containing protein [Rossellomorea aquimaris]|uniref:PilZ domain-containing protein n=1 Tax=Rossellomorea aquimaris TaxID=189382 RepID=UPI0007D0B8A3|nr:PilZ domain-containing protein [Rossellomorea aquimaris]